MNIVILAAGKGTRMRSDLPKVLHPVAGIPMLGHVLATAISLAPKQIVIVVGHGADLVTAAFDSAKKTSSVPINFVLQDPPQGTGHAVAQAVPFLAPGVPTLVLYGDVPLIQASTLQALRQTADQHQQMALLTACLDEPAGYGRIVRDLHGKIHRIVEEKDADDTIRALSEINTGILIAPTPALVGWLGRLTNNNAQHEFYLTDIIEMASNDHQPIGSTQPTSHDEILGINSQSQRADIERRYQQRIAQQLMDQGVRVMDPARIDVRGDLHCEQDVVIDIGCLFEGSVRIGKGAVIGPHCVIRNSQIAAGAKIDAFSHIDGALVGPQAVVGPYARLRPGSELGEGAHVGNFVEIKNTQLGPRSKANHLAYLGDATIGSRVNVGAGTITCNYDGAEKHRTIIEDDAFIGSDTQLVAPVTVGRGATLGAGTTLTQDAPANELTLSRSQQVTIKGYKRPHKKAH
jgi:bifunctional UDP-N-acetylglucosamine pyrophosphorylase/glucosamine-1-phosphate N-acetyltransferase